MIIELKKIKKKRKGKSNSQAWQRTRDPCLLYKATKTF